MADAGSFSDAGSVCFSRDPVSAHGKLHTGAAKELPTAAVGSPVAPPPRRIRQRLELMSFISLVGLVRSYVGGRLAALLLQALAETREEAKSYQ